MTTQYQIIQYQQNNQSFINTVLPFFVVDKISKVLVYDQDDDGYQRKPNPAHYNKIKRYVLVDKPDSFILPTSIILACNRSDIESLIVNVQNSEYLQIAVDSETHPFRIVDGQHRIYGLRESLKTNPNIKDFPLSIIIILTDENRRSVELEIFTDINSKSKRINTDLAELAKHDYQIRENHINTAEINTHIGVKTAFFMKEAKGDNVWQNAIKFDIHSDVSVGIIGISIFTQSIKGIIDRHISDSPFEATKKLEGKDLITYCENAAKIISQFLLDVWNEIIKVKWQYAFKEDMIKNDENEIVKIYYRKDFYIQKGLGVKSLNPIISDIVINEGIGPKAYDKINDAITGSKVKIEDWENGGSFAGFNSESGFNKIKRIILNEISIH